VKQNNLHRFIERLPLSGLYLNVMAQFCEAEMFQVIIPLVTWCIDNGLQKAAHIYSKSAIKKHFLDQMVVERHGDFERCIFTSKTEAADWLAESDFIVQR
jgi:hypothetical protein